MNVIINALDRLGFTIHSAKLISAIASVLGLFSFFSIYAHRQIRMLPPGMTNMLDATVILSMFVEFTGSFILSAFLANVLTTVISAAIRAGELQFEMIKHLDFKSNKVIWLLAIMNIFPFWIKTRSSKWLIVERWIVNLFLTILFFAIFIGGWRQLPLFLVFFFCTAIIFFAFTAIFTAKTFPRSFKWLTKEDFKANPSTIMVVVSLGAIWAGSIAMQFASLRMEKRFRQDATIDFQSEPTRTIAILFRTEDGVIYGESKDTADLSDRQVFFVPFHAIERISASRE